MGALFGFVFICLTLCLLCLIAETVLAVTSRLRNPSGVWIAALLYVADAIDRAVEACGKFFARMFSYTKEIVWRYYTWRRDSK